MLNHAQSTFSVKPPKRAFPSFAECLATNHTFHKIHDGHFDHPLKHISRFDLAVLLSGDEITDMWISYQINTLYSYSITALLSS